MGRGSKTGMGRGKGGGMGKGKGAGKPRGETSTAERTAGDSLKFLKEVLFSQRWASKTTKPVI